MVNTPVFSYCFSSEQIKSDELSVHCRFGSYFLSIDAQTPYHASMDEFCECAIFGYAVHVQTAAHHDLPQQILMNCNSIDEVVEFEKNLGGKYLIFYRNRDHYYILGDATASLPLFYSTTGAVMGTNRVSLIADQLHITPDPQYQNIREHSDISQAMPFDITPYRAIKQLLPNHYYDVNGRTARRFVNASNPQPMLSVTEATQRVLPMIDTMLRYYQSQFSVRCPITAGRDSRVVLAFLLANGFVGSCYTIRHPEHQTQSPDLVIPQALCASVGVSHTVIADEEVTPSDIEQMDRLLGTGSYSMRTLRIAKTVKAYCANDAIFNGDIIGQVGKCSLHRDIPSCFATPGYFRCKLHNYSGDAKKQLRQWIDEIQQRGEKTNLFDLFSIENRLGRWAAQENLIYDAWGQPYLNIFNSRSVIYTWTAVSRKSRKRAMLHLDLMEKKVPSLLSVPFESESLLVRLSKGNGIFYFLSSYLKYYVEKLLFFRRKHYEKIDYHRR